ncbi:uncharacterized protein LOC135396243 isoform X2 [Ornithodoros turicata]|uniref:uncharacterized protein LOC135396243 isoform X2 n=1 Tax=Ornithodoros turicata TaxID=34597 RepID=UPI0031392E85
MTPEGTRTPGTETTRATRFATPRTPGTTPSLLRFELPEKPGKRVRFDDSNVKPFDVRKEVTCYLLIVAAMVSFIIAALVLTKGPRLSTTEKPSGTPFINVSRTPLNFTNISIAEADAVE